MDGKKLSEDEEDDDEQFVVEEAPPPLDAPEIELVRDLNSTLFKNCWKHKQGVVIYFFLLQEATQELRSEDKHGTQSYLFWFLLNFLKMQ